MCTRAPSVNRALIPLFAVPLLSGTKDKRGDKKQWMSGREA